MNTQTFTLKHNDKVIGTQFKDRAAAHSYKRALLQQRPGMYADPKAFVVEPTK